jgi:NAD(P)-dependent dehydrogenase (short-subunit alcohol dehydrogenase family)
MAYPSFTKKFRNDTYDAISPSRPELSQKDRTVVITGGGHGSIGATIALAFAQAGAPRIALMGRTEQTLRDTEAEVKKAHPDTKVMVVICDISNGQSVGTAAHNIKGELGAWDVFINCAGLAAVSEMIHCFANFRVDTYRPRQLLPVQMRMTGGSLSKHTASS